MSAPRSIVTWILIVGGLAACGPGDRDSGRADAEPPGPPDAVVPDAGPLPFLGAVYAHSYDKLYKVDPDTLDVTLVGEFGWPAGSEEELMTDIAIDRDENIIGISFGALYAIDKDTAACTFLRTLSEQQFNGLSYIRQPDDTEILVGVGLSGTLWEIDPTNTDAPVEAGAYGGAMVSSGDLVSVAGLGTVATVKNGSKVDYLARIDDATGAGTIIGSTGYIDIWGIGFWRDKVFGFVATNEFVLIDIHTGAATYISTGPENWAGAGVTTSAPVIIE
jgi:hypothetical protein